jgi:hypothetical protein
VVLDNIRENTIYHNPPPLIPPKGGEEDGKASGGSCSPPPSLRAEPSHFSHYLRLDSSHIGIRD